MKHLPLHFTRNNGIVDETIDRLITLVGPVHHPEIVREIILAALKAGQEDEERADLKLINTTVKEMRFTAKVFGPYRNKRKVTVFGSARTDPDENIYQLARDFGAKLAQAGYMVITGGGGGIMHAVNEGAGPGHSFGVNIRLPFEQHPNPAIEGTPRLITYKYFFNRKVAFLKEASAVALFPGGFGTLDEAMETLTLLQTGKHQIIPLVFIDEPGGSYWTKWVRFFEDELLAQGYISETDFHFFSRYDSVDAAVGHIVQFYHRFHSHRYVGEKLVLRLSSGIGPECVRQLNYEFRDMLTPGGGVYLSGPLEEETDEPDIVHLPRLVVDFNRMSFGRLRRLIDAVNSC